MLGLIHRRQVRTDVPGVYRRGNRFVAVTQYRGRRIKTSLPTKAQARAAKVARQTGERPASRERFEDCVESCLIEYSGGIAPGTREAHSIAMRVYVVPYFRGYRIGDVGPADVKARPFRGSTTSRPRRGSELYRVSIPDTAKWC